MSGGHFDHAQYSMNEIADEIERRARAPQEEQKQHGEPFTPEVTACFEEAAYTIRRAYAMANAADYLLAGDSGCDGFMREWRDRVGAYCWPPRKKPVKGEVALCQDLYTRHEDGPCRCQLRRDHRGVHQAIHGGGRIMWQESR